MRSSLICMAVAQLVQAMIPGIGLYERVSCPLEFFCISPSHQFNQLWTWDVPFAAGDYGLSCSAHQ